MSGRAQGPFWADKRVFITGAAGFLGSWTVKELNRRGATTIGLVRDGGHHLSRRDDPETEPHFIVHGRLEDYDTVLRAINEHEADTVLHLGAQPIVGVANRSPRSTFDANIRGTWNVLDACRELRRQVKRIVVASSDKAYGKAARLPYDESMPLNGNHPYDASKACTDIIAQTYHQSYGLPVCITRAGNFFGGRDLNFNRVVPGVVRWALRGEQPVLRSDGTMIRDYIYVRDVVLAYLTLAERMEDPALHGHAFNFSTEQPISVIALVRRILSAAGREDLQPIILGEATNEIPEQHLSAAKARSLLDWSPEWTLDRALEETLDWYRGWLGAPVSCRRVEETTTAI
ncbi:NAD-dependent epimerase/dehydratase family protein [Falsiroseomonas sp.]|uniref:NAD-dependent epimerase/dehydratase family protein n=1 Tax=Falsiroseomonas sp. TaxID=2870721 RepID=UPI002721206D|nr:NAD-dependent epimerase/dehydratase family protein [Falsiroseomonas sp.]MDO9499295.1 GDP-mannose 4,6-dehydratase [Falsiroseomonas sp.]